MQNIGKNKKVFLFITILICLFPVTIGLNFWNDLPDLVGIHFNIKRSANSFMPKWGVIFVFPVFFAVLNYIVSQIALSKNQNIFYITVILVTVVGLFCSSFIILNSVKNEINSKCIIYAIISIILIFIGWFLPRISKNKTIGFRLPWIISDNRIWKKTHIFAGFVWIILFLISLFTSFTDLSKDIFFFCLVGMIVLPIFYSVFLQNKKKNLEVKH